MRKQKISEIFNNIDTKFIEEAYLVNKTQNIKRNMWMKLGAVAACCALTVVLCVGIFQSGIFEKSNLSESTEFNNTDGLIDKNICDMIVPPSYAPPNYDQTIFLIVPSENDSDNFKGEFENANKYGVSCSPTSEVMENLKGSTFVNPINNQIMQYSYSSCTYRNSSSKEYGAYYSVYDFYDTEDDEIGVLHGTDLICFYFNRNSGDDGSVRLTDKRARSLADAFLASVIGDDLLSDLDIVSITNSSGPLPCSVTYTRLSYGYRTDESLTVFFDSYGAVAGYNGYNLCKYDSLQDRFDNEKIDAAIELLSDKIDSLNLKNIQKTKPVITTNTDGWLFIKINFSYEDDYGMDCRETVFVCVA